MNMFDEIDSLRRDLPKLKNVTDEFSKRKYNNYQIIAFIIMAVGLCIGIIFGNVFPSCGNTSSLYSLDCVTTEFNFSLTLAIWFVAFLISLLIYGMGNIILLLESINKNLTKKK